jgi:hypothetical protein
VGCCGRLLRAYLLREGDSQAFCVVGQLI